MKYQTQTKVYTKYTRGLFLSSTTTVQPNTNQDTLPPTISNQLQIQPRYIKPF